VSGAITEWTIEGAERLPIHGNAHRPEGDPRGVALVVHGWTGHKDRNIVPAVTADLADAGYVAHRFTLSHAGVEKGADEITKLDEFERDSNAFCCADIRAVARAIADGAIPGKDLPLILVGHSRGGATIYRCAAEAEGFAIDDAELAHGWAMKPVALVSIGATATFTRITNEMMQELDEKGYVEKECARAPGGKVRMGRSWYEHHLAHPTRNLFDEALAHVECPCLVAHGDADDSVPPTHADHIASVLHEQGKVRVERVLIEGADHNFNALGYGLDRENIQNPQARALYQAIRKFLAGVV